MIFPPLKGMLWPRECKSFIMCWILNELLAKCKCRKVFLLLLLLFFSQAVTL